MVIRAGTAKGLPEVVLDRDIPGMEWQEAAVGWGGVGGRQVGWLHPQELQEMPGGRGERRGTLRCTFPAVHL